MHVNIIVEQPQLLALLTQFSQMWHVAVPKSKYTSLIMFVKHYTTYEAEVLYMSLIYPN